MYPQVNYQHKNVNCITEQVFMYFLQKTVLTLSTRASCAVPYVQREGQHSYRVSQHVKQCSGPFRCVCHYIHLNVGALRQVNKKKSGNLLSEGTYL